MYRLSQEVTRPNGDKVKVLSVAVIRSQKAENFEMFLEQAYLEVIAPPGLFAFQENTSRIKWEGRVWELDQVPEDYTHGPWWNPELVRYLFTTNIGHQ